MLIGFKEVGLKENIFIFIKIVFMYNDRSINLKIHLIQVVGVQQYLSMRIKL